jgi:uncharacterized protein YjbJ (UPF0337 family)
MGSTRDRIEGEGNKAAGKVKQAAGDLTDNERLREEGQRQEGKGTVQSAIGKAKDFVKRTVDRA